MVATRHQRARYSTFAYVSNSHTRYIHQRLHRFKCCSTNLVVYNVNPQRSTNTSSFLCPGDNLELFSMNKLALSTSSQCKIGLCEDLNQYCLSGTPGLGWHVSRSQDRYPVVGCGGPAGLRVASRRFCPCLQCAPTLSVRSSTSGIHSKDANVQDSLDVTVREK